MHRRTATLIYNFAQSFGQNPKMLSEAELWPLELDKEIKPQTFEEYMEQKKKTQVPFHTFVSIFESTFKKD